MWAQPGLWEHVFEHASNVFAVLSLAAELATEEISDTRSLTSKRRRAILDAAAWARDAVICLLGHCFNLVAASYTSLAGSKSGNLAWPRSLPFPEDFDDYEDYKCAMTDFNSGVRSAMYQKFLSLRSASPSEASKFLSACFRKDKNFEVALTDEESGHLLSIQQALGALESDYHARVEVNLSHDHPTNEKIKESVRSISRARAPATGINGLPALPSTTTADNPQPYSLSELELALTGIQTKKVCIHGPLAAVKADAGQSRRLTLALVNLGRAAEETATSWSTRCISPIRKSGPKVVRKIACLRPISLTADLASVQDALWLGRCKHLLEVFSGHRQMGGKLDTVAVILAIVLHVQIRAFQGLYSYLLFADIKHAYDTADHDGMLLASYLAGIVEVEWRLLQDFLAMDSAVVALGGCISGAFHLRAGIPQGRHLQRWSKQLLKIGAALFEELTVVAQQSGLPPPVQAAAVVERIEPVILYAAELLALTPSILPKLDALQCRWAREIVAGKAGVSLRGPLAVALVGWQLRLSSKVLFKIFIYVAKLRLLPKDHPTVEMLSIASSLVAGTWWHAVQELKTLVCEEGSFPDITATEFCTDAALSVAQSDPAARKALLKQYKCQVLMPLLLARDEHVFDKSA
ncbi:hypothetical protein AK812_SmicGene28511 [Symbiodinium microadriaticum]|uniref:Reverse transcriptase domain-containing protein n=1 Tax=Symbiodinium microadriaticum TaxID=2951 RepID=A0A1Q9D495_SYMMI|nr:hypothetical protein AK812_SmicGene28511 [Symbiodinium microadriaticum]